MLQHKRKTLATLLGVALLAGCGITVPLGKTVGTLEPVRGQQVVIYRPKDNAGMYFGTQLDGKVLPGNATAGSAQVVDVTPGRHTVTVTAPAMQPGISVDANVLGLDVPANERRFVRIRLDRARVTTQGVSAVSGHWRFVVEQVSEDTGTQEIRELRHTH